MVFRMGTAKNFVDELAKHKLLVYFVTLWGAMLFLWTLYGIVEYGFAITGALGVLDLFYHMSELLAGVILVIFSIKLLRPNFLKAVKNERLLVYFLILWAASFFFLGIYYIVDFGPGIFEFMENMIAFLSALAALFAGVVPGLFSWKLLRETEKQITIINSPLQNIPPFLWIKL